MTRDIAVGKYIATLREQARLKQAELARKLTWSPAVLSRVESGERTLGGDELATILNGIGTPEALKLQEMLAREWKILSDLRSATRMPTSYGALSRRPNRFMTWPSGRTSSSSSSAAWYVIRTS